MQQSLEARLRAQRIEGRFNCNFCQHEITRGICLFQCIQGFLFIAELGVDDCHSPVVKLADALSPHGSNATLASVGTFSEGFERFVTSPLYLVGYVRWDARSDQSSFVKRSLQQLSGRKSRNRLLGTLGWLGI